MQFNYLVVKDSFDKARPIANDVLTKFFEYLFEDHPTTQKLFDHTDLEVLKPKLLKSLVLIIHSLESPEQLRPHLKDLGQRHSSYSARSEHYGWFRDAFLKSLAYFFGDDWTAELETNWAQAFQMVSEMMQASSQPQIPFPKTLNRESRLDGGEATLSLANLAKGLSSSASQPALNVGNLLKSMDLKEASHEVASRISLPEELLARIHETAHAMVKKAIEAELEMAMERELKKYVDKGISEFLKKIS